MHTEHSPFQGVLVSALMAMCHKALSLFASRLLPLSGFESHPEHVGKLPVTRM